MSRIGKSSLIKCYESQSCPFMIRSNRIAARRYGGINRSATIVKKKKTRAPQSSHVSSTVGQNNLARDQLEKSGGDL